MLQDSSSPKAPDDFTLQASSCATADQNFSFDHQASQFNPLVLQVRAKLFEKFMKIKLTATESRFRITSRYSEQKLPLTPFKRLTMPTHLEILSIDVRVRCRTAFRHPLRINKPRLVLVEFQLAYLKTLTQK